MFINMLAFTDYFYGSVCHVCKRTRNEDNVVLKVCSGCKLFSYCSYVHQKDHWPLHKEFCKCIQTILKRTGGSHLFQEAKECSITDYREWNRYRTSLIQLAECVMNRPLQPLEQQVFLFPPVCKVCHHYEPAEMISCSQCNSVAYCSVEHKMKDMSHIFDCKKLQLCFTIDIYVSKYHNVCPYPNVSTSIQSQYTTLPENMDMFVKNYASISGTKSPITACLASEILSCSLTVLHVIERVLGRDGISKRDLILHLVGADLLELCAVKTWEILFHWLPYLRFLRIVLIGPELNNVDVLPKSQICSLCEKNRKLEIEYKANLYHNYINSNEHCIPDIVVAFNCGISEFEKVPEKDLWKNSVSSLFRFPSILVILTAYCKEESDDDLTRVFKLKEGNTNAKIFIKGEKNPFASFSPRREWEHKSPASSNPVFYINHYFSVIQT